MNIFARLFGKKKNTPTKILIVEDNPKTQVTLRSIMETQEAEITVVGSGESAFDLLKEDYIPNVMILDINLPGINGGEVLRRLRLVDKYKDIPVIAFSATWDERFNEPFEKDMNVVREYTEAAKLNDKVGGASVSDIIPKFQGQEGVDLVHPRLVVSVAKSLIQQKIDLSPSFQHLLYVSQKQIERASQKKKPDEEKNVSN